MVQKASIPVFAVVLAAALAAGCEVNPTTASAASLTYTEDARLAYEEAMAAFRDKAWEDARALFEEVKKLFPYTRYARLAELRIGDVAFAQEKYAEAIGSYRAFLDDHRSDPNAEYAEYRIAKALYLDIEDTIFLPPQEERDQATTREAHREIRAFLKARPRSRYRRDAAYMLEVVTGRLVRHELFVARFYLRVDAFDAAVARVEYALENYPESNLTPEALVLKGETLLKMDRRREARDVFWRVIAEHGGPFATTARDFLREMGESERPPRRQTPPNAPASPLRPFAPGRLREPAPLAPPGSSQPAPPGDPLGDPAVAPPEAP